MVDVLRHAGAHRPQDGARALRRGHPDVDLRGDDGRRQGAADGHQPRAGPELLPRLRHHLLQRRGHARVRVADLVGGLDPAGRGAGHGPRRRLRAAPAARAGAGAGGGAGRQGRPEVRGGGRGAGCRAAGGRATGSGSTTAPTPASAGAAWTGSSRGCRSGWRSGHATWPRATSPWSSATAGRRQSVALARRGRHRRPPCWPVGRRAAGRGRRRPGRPARRTSARLDEAIEAGAVGFARVRLGALGPDGRGPPGRARAHACAACSGPTGRWPSRATPRTDLVAVGRAGPY